MAARTWESALLRKIGAPVTSQNLKFLRTWQRWEGGHTNNNATWNWLNTTQGPGESINSHGVKAFPNFAVGIQALAATLNNGYYKNIVKYLRAGNPYNANVARDLETWVAGPNGSNPGYAQEILGKLPGTLPKMPSYDALFGPGTPKAALSKDGRGARGNSALVLGPLKIAFGDDPEFLALLSQITDKQAQKTGLVSPGGSVRPIAATSDVVRAAQSQLGKPYVFGSGASTESFDCSDLIQWAYGQIGIDLPRTTFDQIKSGRAVSWRDLQPGDLIFPTNHHVVMYVGNGKVIAAPHTGTVVQYQDVNKFRNPVAIRRVS